MVPTLGTIPDERACGKQFGIIIVNSKSELRQYVVIGVPIVGTFLDKCAWRKIFGSLIVDSKRDQKEKCDQ